MKRVKHVVIVLLVLPFFVIGLIAGGACTIALYAILALPIALNEISHRRYVASLPSNVDEETYTSEEFGPYADWVGDVMKTMPAIPLLLSLGLGEIMLHHARAAMDTRSTSPR